MDLQIQLQLSDKAGYCEKDMKDWRDLYEHHIGMVEKPLPFGLFKIKHNLLNSYFDQDPNGEKRHLDSVINKLCLELGY